MKYSERDALVASLRELADFIEEKGIELPKLNVAVNGWVPKYDRKSYEERDTRAIKRDVKAIVRAMKPVKKNYIGSTFYIKKEFGVINLDIMSSREAVCKPVKTGNKIVHAAQVIPEYTEEEVEWVCTDPLLKASE